MNHVELCWDAQSILGEGPVWDDERQTLFWVDILGHQLHQYDPNGGARGSLDVGQPLTAIAPRRAGGLVGALRDGFAFLEPEDGALTFLADPEAQRSGNRFNDGKCDPAGRFWAGTMSWTFERGAGSLYRLDADLSVHKMLDGVTISNGLAFSADGKTMYYIDSIPGTLSAFDYEPGSGEIHNRRVILDVPDDMGHPDGMTIDEEGMLWIAFYGGAAVRRFDPARRGFVGEFALPVSRVTSCAFGGARLDTLFVTTATEGMTEEERTVEPRAGGLFAVQPGVRGVTAHRFGG